MWEGVGGGEKHMENNVPKVSVIIPVYNTENYLRKCLDSVCNQTLKDIEIICINDCSTDSSLEILKEYSSKDSRIKLIDFKENKGAAVARNTGIDEAQGVYIGFVDSDDFIDLDFYEKLYKKAVETNADAVKGKIKIHSDSPNVEKEVFYDNNDDIKTNKAYFYHSFSTAIYNTNFIKTNNIHFPEGLNYFEDPYFSILATLHYKKIKTVDNTKYYYVTREYSACTKQNEKRFCDEKKAISLLIDIINKSKITKEQYLITFGFLIRQVVNMYYNVIETNYNKDYLDFCLWVYSNCKYPKEQINFFIYEKTLFKKRYEKKKLLLELRTNVQTRIKLKDEQ